uniref:UMP-CMP kinase isoform X2 n=1 Tax=Rhizophora mucronata TaxID=61149 RepID=A0A2P2KQS9_RHIMU
MLIIDCNYQNLPSPLQLANNRCTLSSVSPVLVLKAEKNGQTRLNTSSSIPPASICSHLILKFNRNNH